MLPSKEMVGSGEREAAPKGDDAWYDSEESTRLGMIAEVQRIQRRTRSRPWPVLIAAVVLSTIVTYKIATRPIKVEAEVVLALAQGSFVQRDLGIPVEELRAYVENVLLPDRKLGELLASQHRASAQTAGTQYAIESLREDFEIHIWKNSFASEDDGDRSARIGITVMDTDPDRAAELARGLADVVIGSAQEQRAQMTTLLANRIAELKESATARLVALVRESSEKALRLDEARSAGKVVLAQAIGLDLAQLKNERDSATHTLSEIANSTEGLADRISAVGLDVTISVVDEHRGQLPEHRGFLIMMLGVIITFAALIASAMLFGAFDSRVHDTDDVERLNLPVLGHMPGFPGDHVGSLEARGVSRARVPSFSRWRSHR